MKFFIDAGTLKYTVNTVDFSQKDGAAKLIEINKYI